MQDEKSKIKVELDTDRANAWANVAHRIAKKVTREINQHRISSAEKTAVLMLVCELIKMNQSGIYEDHGMTADFDHLMVEVGRIRDHFFARRPKNALQN
jgi:hypothetical protein